MQHHLACGKTTYELSRLEYVLTDGLITLDRVIGREFGEFGEFGLGMFSVVEKQTRADDKHPEY